MGRKSIASKALATCQKNEVERLKPIKEKFLNTMRKELDDHVNRYEPWTAIGSTSYIYLFEGFSSDDLFTVGREVGFKITNDSGCFKGDYLISVPECVKGQRKTPAQLMVYRCNAEIKKRIKSDKMQAKKMCKEVLQKVKAGDFESCKYYSDSYRITIPMPPCPDPSQVFLKEVSIILEKEKFNFHSIDSETGLWQLEVSEN